MIPFLKPKRVYLDYASAPPVRAEAIRAMHAVEHLVGNPGAIHHEAVEAKATLQDARERIAKVLAVKAREIVFTSGLSEANNLAIVGYAKTLERTRRTLEGTHWLVSSIEHSSVLACFGEVERLGGSVEFIDPDHRGLVSAEKIAQALRQETVFVSLGWANNELGTIQPLRDIAAMIRAHEAAHGTIVVFHTDAGQAPLYEASTVHSLGVDLMALGANKLYGPHGIGALFLSNRISLAPVILGGPQERGLRAGTENVTLAQGFARAFECAAAERSAESRRLKKIRDELARAMERVDGAVINGDVRHALPHMLNVSIPHISSEYLTLALDARGFALSTKSACREGEESRSHVVASLAVEEWRAAHTLRISLGRDTRSRDVQALIAAIHSVLLSQRK